MKTNIGSPDRILRVIAGFGLVTAAALGYIGIWGWVGLILLITGLLSFCPIYMILGLNSCSSKSKYLKK